MPSETSKWRCGCSSRSHAAAAVMRRGAATVVRDPVARRLVQSNDDVAAAVVGDLHGVDLDAAPRHASPAGAGSSRPPARRRPADRRSAAAGRAARPRRRRRRVPARAASSASVTAWWPWSASGSGYFGRPREADTRTAPSEHPVPVAPVVEHGDAEVRLGDVDVAVGAHLELGGVPRRRGVRRPPHGPELHAARRGVGVHVERERASTAGARRDASRARSRRRGAASRRAARSARWPTTGRTTGARRRSRRAARRPRRRSTRRGPTGTPPATVHDSRSQASYCTGWSGASSSSAPARAGGQQLAARGRRR